MWIRFEILKKEIILGLTKNDSTVIYGLYMVVCMMLVKGFVTYVTAQ